MTRQKIKKKQPKPTNWQQFSCQQPAACASSQGSLRTDPQRLRPTKALPHRGQGFLRPHWWSGAGCWMWGGCMPQVRCSGPDLVPPSLPSALLGSPPAPCPPSCRLGKQLWGCSQSPWGVGTHTHTFRALQFGILPLQQVLTLIHLTGFVRNSRERFLLPLCCLFFTCVCSV